jgi:hypothetical protein
VRRCGRQCCSRASHTGRQYCAVDSMTTSSTSCATSQPASARRSVGVVPTFWRAKWKSPSTSTSASTTASIFLWTSIPAIRYGTAVLLGGAESVPRHINQGRELSVGLLGLPTLNHSGNHARSGSNSCSASRAPLVGSISPFPRDYYAHADFHCVSGATGLLEQLRIPSLAPSQLIHDDTSRLLKADSPRKPTAACRTRSAVNSGKLSPAHG